ncbi:ABC transporter permease [Kingella negevensis]|uniref:ABC transporter permease n=1 Tax=Kingella negevensis TaxID=1522312 RepID=UPI0025507610|nr:iron ABC transporter permease [Kingella negevensis]MDK4679250.1 iron ABC transporter permease [Kingella negevensis]MDK4683028.1 iron ABC transporter permease [Kingella negevensis]MDK4691228.1 iron ABC transporter permease [Kingella negevensis]MDK4693624.1 iron ABC transporter permease [Kingella negevensis]MDK4700440.1 iron ABC transporter permease [Kingella negevensis]
MHRHFTTLLIATIPIAFLITLVAAPLWAMLNYQAAAPLWPEMLHDSYYTQKILWTTQQAAYTVLLTLTLGIPTAYALARLKFFGRKLILRLLMLPFIMPTLVAGMGVLALFGEHGFLWRGWTDTAALLLYGNVFFNLPVMIRTAYQGFLAVPANRLAAAQTLGANAWQRFWRVEMPVLRNWLAGGACLVFLYCFSGFGLALLLGGQQYSTIEVEIYQLIAYELNMESAAVLVWLVLGITAIAGTLYAWISRQTDAAEIRFRLPEKPKTLPEKLLLLFALAVLLLCCALPLFAVVFQAAKAGDAWRVLWDEETLAALWNTLRFSGCAVALAAVLGLLHAALARRLSVMRSLTFLSFMVSPVCLSFGVLLLYPEWAATLPMLIALYALLAYPFVTKDILAAWDALPENYTKAARVFGATPFQAACSVTLPLLLPALRRGLTLAAATCIGEFAASLFLSRPEWTTLTTLIYRYLGKVGTENHDRAMVLTLVLMVLSCAAFLALDTKEKQPER